MDEIGDNKESKTNNLGRWATDLYRNPGLRGNKDGISEGNLELEIVTIDNINPIQSMGGTPPLASTKCIISSRKGASKQATR